MKLRLNNELFRKILNHYLHALSGSCQVLVLMSTLSLSVAASSQNQTDANGFGTSENNCSDVEQILHSQQDRIQSDPGLILTLIRSEYACNERNEAHALAVTLCEHSRDKLWGEAIFRAGQIASAVSDFDTAEKLFKSIQNSYADQAALNSELANVQLQTGRYGQAEESYARAAKLEPGSAEIQLGLAGARALSGHGEHALSGLAQAIQQFPTDQQFLIAYGDVLQQLPEYSAPTFQERAQKYLRRAISMDHTSARAHYLLGQLLIAQSKLDEAIRELEIAVQYEPDFRQAHFALSRGYRRLGRISDADEQYSLFRKLEYTQTAP